MPTFTHDCQRCKYLATGVVNGEQTDWWVCSRAEVLTTVIGRYGDDGHEYWSMPIAMLESAAASGSTHASAALAVLSEAKAP